MKKVFKTLIAVSATLVCTNTFASVSLMMNDFEDGSTHGWVKGRTDNRSKLPVTVAVEDNGNHYLKYLSLGENPTKVDKKITLASGKEWRGNYNDMGVTSITARMKVASGDKDLVMHANFANSLADLRTRFTTEGVAVAADGEWHDVVFDLRNNVHQVSLHGHGKSTAAFSVDEVLGNVAGLRFTQGVLGETYMERRGPFEGWNAGEDIKAEVWFDDIKLSTAPIGGDVSNVPLPGAVWMFTSAIAGLSIARKRKRS